MKPGLNQSTQLRQELKINPRLYQAMDLLYMPLLDLQQHLKQESSTNPFLEMVEPRTRKRRREKGRDEERRRRKSRSQQRRDRLEGILLDGFDAAAPRGARGEGVLRAGHRRYARSE
jgi:RNA polymerase sigma-54 factor